MENSAQHKILWKDDYRIHNNQIDEEHEKLFTIAQQARQIHNLTDEKEKKQHLNKVLREVYSFTNFHLASEEKYMKEHEYPFYDEHKRVHRELLDKITFIIANLTIFSIERAEKELYNFVQKIFVEHIITHDVKIAHFVQNKPS